MMANAVMEAFPKIPNIAFGTTKTEMVHQRKHYALQLLKASVFDIDNNCAMCSTTKPPGPGPSFTDWIQCDRCSRWFHAQCLQMDTAQLQNVQTADWNCCLCQK
ncbi:jmjC domain-containing histone demethylation protein 1-like [Hippoglossus stenolepis]|uniref:jmjC domain-containing histone demethylation protein 1-like n=1 Tax=Hippoglossus stenolepis TaxID=195615 RepID=UPI001FAFB129|nr:jmjC domain-containing histone demethylation protein 1-like [Hippoglossus stenolepis]